MDSFGRVVEQDRTAGSGAKRPRGRKFQRRPGAGRKPMAARQVFSAIVYVLRTGCQWKALPKEYGSAGAVQAQSQRWQREEFFRKMPNQRRKRNT